MQEILARNLTPVHERMSVILKPESYDFWLDEKVKKTDELEKILVPYPAEEMSSHAVSKSVNYAQTDSEELIKTLNSL